MPNYVKNIVTVSEETMNKIKEKYCILLFLNCI